MFIGSLWLMSIIATLIIADYKRLGMLGYFLLAVFIGPLAVIVVLMMESKAANPQPTTPAAANNLQEARKQLEELKQSLYVQELKIQNLENLINSLSPTQVVNSAEDATNAIDKAPEVKPPSVVMPLTVPPETIHAAPARSSDMELNFGRNWLNKIGMAVLALGIAFLISYTFRFFGPALKIIFGYSVAAILFFIGFKLETKEKYMSYGRGLLGGAWAIAYFTTYACQHFEASRIIASPTVDFFLLMAVVAAMIFHVVRYKSEAMMSVALLVAYVTTTLGEISNLTVCSTLLLGILVLFLAYRFQWVKTYILSMLLTYAIHYLWVVPHINIALAAPDLMNFIFLSCYASLFFIGIHLLRESSGPQGDPLAAVNFGNIALYGALSYPLILELFYPHRYFIVLIVGVVYLMAALGMKVMGRQKLFLSDMVAAIFILTYAVSIKFMPTTTLLIWLIEAPCLLYIGFSFKEKVYKYLSYGLSIWIALRILCAWFMPTVYFFGMSWSWHAFMSIWAMISAALCFVLIHMAKKEAITEEAEHFFDHYFSLAATYYLISWIAFLVHQPWKFISFTIEGIGLLLLGFVLSLKRFRVYAYILFLCAVISYILGTYAITVNPFKWLIVGFETFIFFALYYCMKFVRQMKNPDLFDSEEFWGYWAGLVLLVFSIHQYIHPQWISLSMGIASVVLIMLGLIQGGKIERLGGLMLLALTLGRVVMIDLSGLGIIIKIVTLIVLGLLLLGVSFIYNKFDDDKK